MLRLDPDARRTPQHDPRILSRGCSEMFAAIIQNAFHEVFAPAGVEGQKELIRSEAISLLTSRTGEWAAHRRFLCDLIGLDSDVLRRHVHEILMGQREPNLAMPGIERSGVEQFKQKQVDAARAVYQRQFDRPKQKHRQATLLKSELQAKHRKIELERQEALARKIELEKQEAIKLQDQQRTVLEKSVNLELLPSTRTLARCAGTDFYYTAKLCIRGHLDRRRVSDGSCLSCESVKRAA